MSEHPVENDRGARIVAGRARHGVGDSEDFPGNVCHLVSPVVGSLRRWEQIGESPTPENVRWLIDRLGLVLDMAREEAERRRPPGDVLGDAVEAVLIADARLDEPIPLALAEALDNLRRCRYGARPIPPGSTSGGDR